MNFFRTVSEGNENFTRWLGEGMSLYVLYNFLEVF